MQKYSVPAVFGHDYFSLVPDPKISNGRVFSFGSSKIMCINCDGTQSDGYSIHPQAIVIVEMLITELTTHHNTALHIANDVRGNLAPELQISCYCPGNLTLN